MDRHITHPLWQKSLPSPLCHEKMLSTDLRVFILTLAGPGAVNAAAKVDKRWRDAANNAYDQMVTYQKPQRVLLLKTADTKPNVIRPTKAEIKRKHADRITKEKRNKRDDIGGRALKKLQIRRQAASLCRRDARQNEV